MTTPTGPAPTHHYVITLQKPISPGVHATGSWNGLITPGPGTTRSDVFQQLVDHYTQQNPVLAGADVLFFALERNHL